MALFRTTAEIRKYIAIDVNMKFDKLKPSIDDAELRFIKPLLGESFYTEFSAAYAAAATPGELSNDNQAILPYIQKALAFYAGYLMIDEIGVQVGDLGIQQQANQNSQPAPAWKVTNLLMKYITSADSSAELLLEFLEDHASPSVYGSWYADIDANTAMSGTIVYKTSIASKYIDINDSRRVFLRLKKRIRDIESTYVKSLICGPQYEEIATQLKTGSLSAANARLIEKLEPIISKKALYLTLPAIAVSIDDKGIMMYSSNDSVTQKQIAGIQEKNELRKILKDVDQGGYESDEATFKSFLSEKIADYPLISSSPCWTTKPDDGSNTWRPINDPCNKHFSV
jgi:hypothetical protein